MTELVEPDEANDRRDGPGTHSGERRSWWLTYATLTIAISSWSLATPPWNAPDEPSQAMRSWALAHGQLVGATPSSAGLSASVKAFLVRHPYLVAVRVPRVYRVLTSRLSCVAFRPLRSASCMVVGSVVAPGVGTWWTYHARYFPLYFLVTGMPSLIVRPGTGQLYAMRLAGGLAAAAFLASAISTARRSRRGWLGAGVVLAMTPTVLFLAASVNASGLEIAAAIALWTSGSMLARTSDVIIDRRLIDRFGVAAVVLVLTRPLAPLWFAVALVALLATATPTARRMLFRSRRARGWATAVAAALLIAFAWDIWAGTLDARHYTGSPVRATVAAMVRHNITTEAAYLRQMVGVFGWLDTRSPSIVYLLWGIVTIAVLAVALLGVRRRVVAVVATLVVAVVVVPFVLEDLNVRTIGFQWQGRYTLPLAVGVPIVACSTMTGRRWSLRADRVARIAIGVAVVVAQSAAFVQLLRRFSVGANGPLWFFDRVAWRPPVPALALVVVEFLALSAVVAATLTRGRTVENALT